jgi:hypothetical protein
MCTSKISAVLQNRSRPGTIAHAIHVYGTRSILRFGLTHLSEKYTSSQLFSTYMNAYSGEVHGVPPADQRGIDYEACSRLAHAFLARPCFIRGEVYGSHLKGGFWGVGNLQYEILLRLSGEAHGGFACL